MPLTQKIGKIKFYINNDIKSIDENVRKDAYSAFEKKFDKLLSKSEYKEALFFENTAQGKGDFIIETHISILYSGLYQTYVNYNYIHPYLTELISELKNVYLNEAKKKYKLAIMMFDLVSLNNICTLLEHSEAHLLKHNNNDQYTLYPSEDSLIESVKKNIHENFYFVNCNRKTNFHEIDPKLIEARLCLAYGLANSSISLICITLEETLKTLLKYNFIDQNQSKETKPSLKEVKDLSNKAQKNYGSNPFGKCIKLAHKEELINEEEKKILKKINDFLRNAHIHSDKSKMFANNKSSVKMVGISEGRFKIVDEEELSMNDLIYAQGYMQFMLAEKNAKKIFYDIEELIFTICKRYIDNNRELLNELTTTPE